jgi:release factor glutamine methyltransferase
MTLGIGEAWRQACRRIDRLDARLLIESACGCTHADLIARPERELSPEQAARFEELVSRREAGEPLAYLLGSAWFHDLEFTVTPDVLIPRADTEVLVDVAVDKARGCANPRIVDLGTGSGIVAILLARLCSGADVTAVDCSESALEVARLNAARHGAQVRFFRGDWCAPLADDRFDLIVSNPPYVAADDPHLTRDGLPFEPRGALTDAVEGGTGMACIERIVADAPAHLRPGGWLLLEHGYDQAVEVRGRLAEAGLCDIASWKDRAGIERVSGGRWAVE